MLNSIWMTDLHFVAQGLVHGVDPRKNLSTAIAHINAHYADHQFCIISGDLVNQETTEDYTALEQQLKQLKIPYFPMIGNHDERDLIRSLLPLPENCMAEFIQYSISTDEGLILCLDTHKAGEVEGELCNQRLEWLKNTLDAAQDTPVFIFMHHHPMELGLPMLDSIKLQNGDEFLDLIASYNSVKYLFMGHVHRALSGTMRGIPFSTMSAISFQAPAPVPNWTWDDFTAADEAPAFGVVSIKNADVNIKYTQFSQ
ncbi:MAG: phosphodiesterase [OCS116 cluster bacterium]|nr:phosphodiesterase [OCS116 cluster bacterium]